MQRGRPIDSRRCYRIMGYGDNESWKGTEQRKKSGEPQQSATAANNKNRGTDVENRDKYPKDRHSLDCNGKLRISPADAERFRALIRIQRVKKRPPLPVALPLIRVIRGQRVILDSDLARLYGVSTSQLNQQFRRNRRRFPIDFAFTLTRKEAAGGLSQIVTALGGRNRGKPPVAYTEHGAVMAANVLKSDRATTMSVEVVRAFVRLRQISSSHEKIARILHELETAVRDRLDGHDKQIAALFELMAAIVDDAPISSSGKKRIGTA